MPRVAEINSANSNPILEEAFSNERNLFGDLLNPTRVLAHCPPILRAANQLYAAFDESGLLPPTYLRWYTRGWQLSMVVHSESTSLVPCARG